MPTAFQTKFQQNWTQNMSSILRPDGTQFDPVEKKFYTGSWVLCYYPPPLLLPIYLPGVPLSQELQDRILPNNFVLAWKLLLSGNSSTDPCTFFKPFLKSLSYHEVWSDCPLQNCTMTSSLLPNPPHTLISHSETLISYPIDWRTGDWWIDFFLLLFLPNSLWTVMKAGDVDYSVYWYTKDLRVQLRAEQALLTVC